MPSKKSTPSRARAARKPAPKRAPARAAKRTTRTPATKPAARAAKRTTRKPATKQAARGKPAAKAAVRRGKAAAKASKSSGPAKRIERKAPPRAPESKRPVKRQQAERVKVGPLRELARPDAGHAGPKRARGAAALAKNAREVLENEFERVLAMKEKLAAEQAIGGREKGRESARQTERLRMLLGSLEGMNRFAMAMQLITPAESRELYAKAMQRGLYEGWR